MKEYFLQTQAPAGNWTDCLGSIDKETCVGHGKWRMVQPQYAHQKVRVVERVDTPVWEGTEKSV